MPDIQKKSNKIQHRTDHSLHFWLKVYFVYHHACCLLLLVFCIFISQGSVATQLMRGEIFNYHFIANCPQNVTVKEF